MSLMSTKVENRAAKNRHHKRKSRTTSPNRCYVSVHGIFGPYFIKDAAQNPKGVDQMILRNGNCVSSHLWFDMPTKFSATNTIYFKYQNYLDGSYHFGYDTGLSAQQSFREEIRLASGQVIGQYGFIDQHGVLRVTTYSADQRGYRYHFKAE